MSEPKEHDVFLLGKDGIVKDLVKRASSHERPHAPGCVGCRREQVCISCGKTAVLGKNRCVSGACARCCQRLHTPHQTVYRILFKRAS